MTVRIGVGRRRITASVLAVATLSLVTVLAGPLGSAEAAEASGAIRPSSLTNFATDPESELLGGSLSTCHHSSIRVETSATFIFGQSWLDSVTYTNPHVDVPAGQYTLNDCVTPFEGEGLHQSWLDPAPDPDDPTSGVAISMQHSAGVTRPTRWGSLLIPTS